MTAPYKKRALSGWNHDKKQSNRDERQYEQVDIDEQTSETSSVSKKVNAKKHNKREKEISRALSTIRWALKMARGDINALKARAVEESKNKSSWNYMTRYYNEVRLLSVKLDIWLKDENISPKLRRHIEEVKDKLGVLK